MVRVSCVLAPLTAGERQELQAGCGVLTIVGRLDRGAPLAPVLAALRESSPDKGYLALIGAERTYRTRLALGVDYPTENSHRSARLAVMAVK